MKQLTPFGKFIKRYAAYMALGVFAMCYYTHAVNSDGKVSIKADHVNIEEANILSRTASTQVTTQTTQDTKDNDVVKNDTYHYNEKEHRERDNNDRVNEK